MFYFLHVTIGTIIVLKKLSKKLNQTNGNFSLGVHCSPMNLYCIIIDKY